MDMNLTNAIVGPASADMPESRSGAPKGEGASLLPFELALLSELQLLTPACELPVTSVVPAGN